MDTICADIFNIIAPYLDCDDVEVLYMIGQRRLQSLITTSDCFDRICGSRRNYSKLRLYNTICIHSDILSSYSHDPYFRYKKSLVSDGIKSSITHICLRNNYVNLTISCMDLSEFINLKSLLISTHHVLPTVIPDSVEELEIYLTASCDVELIRIGMTKIYMYSDYNHASITQYTKFNQLITCNTITHIKFEGLHLPSNILSMLPSSILHLIINNCNVSIDMKHKNTTNLLSLTTDADIVGIKELPNTLTKLSVTHALKDIIDMSILPNLKTLYELGERTIDDTLRDYSTLPSGLLDLQLKDRHIEEIDLNIIIRTCPKLARFKNTPNVLGYNHRERIFNEYVCSK